MATTPNLQTVLTNEFNSGAEKFKESSWVARLAISLTGMAARADIENIDATTGLVKSGPNIGLTARQVVEGALGQLAVLEANYDPDNRFVRLKEQARNPGALPLGQSVDTLSADLPAKADEIRGAAKSGLIDGFVTSSRNFATLDADLAALQGAGKIDASLLGEVRTQAATKVQEKVKGIMERFDNGEIETLRDLEDIYNAEQNPEVQALLNARIVEIRRTQDIFNAPGVGSATDRVINNALSGLNPPMRTIYRNMLTTAQNQMTLETTAMNSKIAAEQAEVLANTPAGLEIFSRRVMNIVRYAGPAVLVSLLIAGAGAGTGALIGGLAGGSVAAAVPGVWWGLGVGGGVGILGGISAYSESGGLKDWRSINALQPAAQAAIDAAAAKAGSYIAGNELKNLDYIRLLTEVAANGETIRRGLRDPQEVEKLRKVMRINAGLGDEESQGSISKALTAVLNSQFS
jgi:hypothetical protein